MRRAIPAWRRAGRQACLAVPASAPRPAPTTTTAALLLPHAAAEPARAVAEPGGPGVDDLPDRELALGARPGPRRAQAGQGVRPRRAGRRLSAPARPPNVPLLRANDLYIMLGPGMSAGVRITPGALKGRRKEGVVGPRGAGQERAGF